MMIDHFIHTQLAKQNLACSNRADRRTRIRRLYFDLHGLPPTPEAVKAAHAAALANGGSDEGAPGPRPLYGPDVYAAYARDPDGNKMSFITSVKAED